MTIAQTKSKWAARARSIALVSGIAFLSVCFASRLAQAQTYSELYTFSGGADGSGPQAGMVADSAGNLYGTSTYGGNLVCRDGCGVVYKVTPAGSETVLHTFTGVPDGELPYAGLVRDSAGNLYGTTSAGGAHNHGTVFELSAAGKETILYSFEHGKDGADPVSSLIRDSAGNLYGTALSAGSFGHGPCGDGCGVVFKLSPAGKETVLYAFPYTGTNGGEPLGGLVMDSAGNLYGTTLLGGADNFGTVFKVNPSGNETVLYSFTGGTDGKNPEAGLAMDSAGNLYGTTTLGGDAVADAGVVFEVDAAGAFSVLYTFTGGADGGAPVADLVRDSAGNLYGTASLGGDLTGSCAPAGCGVVFEVDPSGTETVLHSFTGGADGSNPRARVVGPSKGYLYGATTNGGKTGGSCPFTAGCGLVFKLSVP
jgi:uncharacterized repeat protein (TIGR03803 family)